MSYERTPRLASPAIESGTVQPDQTIEPVRRAGALRRESEAVRLAALSKAIRESTLKRLRSVPGEAVGWRPSPGALSFFELAHHLVRADEWLFAKLADPALPGMVARVGEAGEPSAAAFDALLARLEMLGERRAARLGALKDAELEGPIEDDRFGGEVALWWTIVRGNLEHEAHHRGQLAAYLRIVNDAQTERR